MNPLEKSGVLFQESNPWKVAGLLAIFTFFGFAVDRLLWERYNLSLSNFPDIVIYAVVLIVATLSLYNSVAEGSLLTELKYGLGPIFGLGIYLVIYHLLFPPSTDSPTIVIFTIFSLIVVSIVIISHMVGYIVNSLI